MFKKTVLAAISASVLTLVSSITFAFSVEVLQRTDFTDGLSSPWKLNLSNQNNAYSYVKDERLVVHMDQKGTNKWDVAVEHNDFTIYNGHKYTVKFKVTASKNCKIYAKIGDRGEPYGEAWNNNWSPYALTADKVLEINDTFTATKDYKDAQLAFHLGGELAGSLPYDVKFISISLNDDSADPKSTPTPTPVITPSMDIRVNQLGYYSDSIKKATIKTDSTSTLDWELKNSLGVVVASGKTQAFGQNHASGENVQIIDFSSYTTPGTGYKLFAGNASSHSFDIGNNIYSQLQYDALKYFYHARSGIEIKIPYCVESQWARAARDNPDKARLVPGINYTGPSTLDVTGGWYDGGFYTKYTSYNAMALWKIQNQYENAKITGKSDAFKDNTMNIPESGNGIPDILDEARWGMEGMLKLQIPQGFDRAGMAPYQINEAVIGLDVAGTGPLISRVYYPPTTDATLNLASCAAQAARLWKSIDTVFSDKCVAAAETAWAAAMKNPAIYQPHPSGQAPSSYPNDYFEDEFYWAACELYLTTGKNLYLDYIKTSKYFCQMPVKLTAYFNDGFQGSIDRNTTAGLGTLSLALNKASEFPAAVKNITNAADLYLSIQREQGYGMPLAENSFPYKIGSTSGILDGYPNESNLLGANNGIIMAYAYSLTGDKKYLNGVGEFMDYLLGRNPIVKSYITGYGKNPVKNPYHAFFAYQDDKSFPKAPGGFLVSGATSSLNAMRFVNADDPRYLPAQKSYEDDYYNYFTNEVNVDLNASLAWLASFEEAKGLIPTPKKPIPGDINEDGKVNMGDLVLLAISFNSTYQDPNYNNKCDVNNDGVINMHDVMVIAMRFGYNESIEPGTVYAF
ncbi:MAG TPA: glycoside hydrolase family 9 protein [Pseudobacteroides sp.]|uniref:glycoside hydrolase family 9 protein n=1 Tax=Pseudobacteroides sp. TaxID=1968840 RepID=UPI002F930943